MTESEITELLFLRDPPARSDLALVFGHHDPQLSAQRVRHAASLFLAGLTPKVLLTGGPTGDDTQSEAEIMAAVARDAGVPDAAILLETRSRTTVENLSLSVALLTRENLLLSLTAIHLVSCPWHMRRVYLTARKSFPPEVRLLCAPHEEGCDERTWTQSPDCVLRVVQELEVLDRFVRRGLLPGRPGRPVQ